MLASWLVLATSGPPSCLRLLASASPPCACPFFAYRSRSSLWRCAPASRPPTSRPWWPRTRRCCACRRRSWRPLWRRSPGSSPTLRRWARMSGRAAAQRLQHRTAGMPSALPAACWRPDASFSSSPPSSFQWQEEVDAMVGTNAALLDGASLAACLRGVGHLLNRRQIAAQLARDPTFLFQVRQGGEGGGGGAVAQPWWVAAAGVPPGRLRLPAVSLPPRAPQPSLSRFPRRPAAVSGSGRAVAGGA